MVVVLLGIYSSQATGAGDRSLGEKDCGPAVGGGEQAKIDLERIKAIAPLKGVKWSQLGGSINDASCLSKTEIYGVVEVRSVEDIAKTLAFARDNKLSVTIAGVRHSMGGQAFRKGGIVLDLRGFNKIVLNESSRSVTVQPGCHLARHPEPAAPALCGSRHAVDRYLQRRRLDRRMLETTRSRENDRTNRSGNTRILGQRRLPAIQNT